MHTTQIYPGEEVLAFRIRHILPATQHVNLPSTDEGLVHLVQHVMRVARLNSKTVREWLTKFLQAHSPEMDLVEKKMVLNRFQQAFGGAS